MSEPKRTRAILRGLVTLTQAGVAGDPKDIADAAGFHEPLDAEERNALEAAAGWVRDGCDGERTETIMTGLVVLANVGLNAEPEELARLCDPDMTTLPSKERYRVDRATDWIFTTYFSGLDDDCFEGT